MEFINGGFVMSEEVYSELADNMIGLCINCGEEYGDCLEPDARYVQCESCEKKRVFGVEELLLIGKIWFSD